MSQNIDKQNESNQNDSSHPFSEPFLKWIEARQKLDEATVELQKQILGGFIDLGNQFVDLKQLVNESIRSRSKEIDNTTQHLNGSSTMSNNRQNEIQTTKYRQLEDKEDGLANGLIKKKTKKRKIKDIDEEIDNIPDLEDVSELKELDDDVSTEKSKKKEKMIVQKKKKAKKAKKEKKEEEKSTVDEEQDDEDEQEEENNKEEKRNYPAQYKSLEEVCNVYDIVNEPNDARKIDTIVTKDMNKWNFYELKHKETEEYNYLYEDSKGNFRMIPKSMVKKIFEKIIVRKDHEESEQFRLTLKNAKTFGNRIIQNGKLCSIYPDFFYTLNKGIISKEKACKDENELYQMLK